MNVLKQSIGFKTIIRNQLTPWLLQHDYKLIHDNDVEDKNSTENWVFRVKYQKQHTLEISNDDWRDYIEFFNVIIDEKEIITINIMEFDSLVEAFGLLKKHLQPYL